MTLKVGTRLKDWVTLEALDKPAEDFARTPAQWTPVWSGRVNITPVSGREFIEGQRVEEGITHVINMRWNPDFQLTGEHRFRVGDTHRRLYVNSVVDVQERRKYWLIKCVETP